MYSLFNILLNTLSVLYFVHFANLLETEAGKKTLLNSKVLQLDPHDRESCSASYREFSLAAELAAILSFCTECGRSEKGRMMGEG